MKRNVILMGGKTYVLSLPHSWVKKYGIKKGEELDVEERGNQVIVSTERSSDGGEIEVDFSALNEMIGRAVGGLYKAGYDKVRVKFETKEQLQKIEETLHRTCVGFQITKQDENYVLIECLSEVLPDEFDKSLKRLFFSIESMNQDLVEAMENKDIEALKKIIEKDDQINRLADFCRRVLNKDETQIILSSGSVYYIVEQLERLGDYYKAIARRLIDRKIGFTKKDVDLFKALGEYFILLRELYYDFNLEKYELFGVRRKELLSMIPEKSDLLWYQGFILETVFEMNGILATQRL
ncbi:phosphate uptake regulator PhoU [Candidatus Woesearchaeota archaeon]|nr:phosphate uptake regulator PhoU [Candidatus Woesearchaeota archaeon]